jgi:DNA-binding LacI/PurR family transcriptional regulator
MLEHPDPPTAVFAFSDEMAIGAIRAACEHGLRVPDDLSVAGFDDHDVAWAIDLTTVAQPVMGLGETVTELLFEHLRDPRCRRPTRSARSRSRHVGAPGQRRMRARHGDTLDRCGRI